MGAACEGDITDAQVAMARTLPCVILETLFGQKL